MLHVLTDRLPVIADADVIDDLRRYLRMSLRFRRLFGKKSWYVNFDGYRVSASCRDLMSLNEISQSESSLRASSRPSIFL